MQPDGPDGPTWTNLPLPHYEPSEPGASRELGGAPTWPQLRDGPRRSLGYRSAPLGNLSTLALGVSFFANVVLLITLIAVLALARGGYFAPHGSTSGGTTPIGALGTPTATATAAPSPTASVGWLQVTPDSIQLGCSGGQPAQFVMLANNGPQRVRWQVSFSGAGGQAGVTVNPNQGDLHAGASVILQIQINGDAGGGQQGTIQFVTNSQDAGAPPTLSYVTNSCNN